MYLKQWNKLWIHSIFFVFVSCKCLAFVLPIYRPWTPEETYKKSSISQVLFSLLTIHSTRIYVLNELTFNLYWHLHLKESFTFILPYVGRKRIVFSFLWTALYVKRFVHFLFRYIFILCLEIKFRNTILRVLEKNLHSMCDEICFLCSYHLNWNFTKSII